MRGSGVSCPTDEVCTISTNHLLSNLRRSFRTNEQRGPEIVGKKVRGLGSGFGAYQSYSGVELLSSGFPRADYKVHSRVVVINLLAVFITNKSLDDSTKVGKQHCMSLVDLISDLSLTRRIGRMRGEEIRYVSVFLTSLGSILLRPKKH